MRFLVDLWIPYLLLFSIFISLSIAHASTTFTVGIAVTKEKGPDVRGWPHLNSFYVSSIATIQKAVFRNFQVISRCRIVSHAATLDSRGQSQYTPRNDIDYLLHLVLRRADKLFRNKTIYFSNPNSAISLGVEDTQAGETLALPVFSAAIEARLIDPIKRRVLWSTLQDSSVLLPHSNNYVLNVDKYPGYTPPEVIKEYVAPILMQRFRSPSSLRMLQAADRWYISDAEKDGAVGGRLLAEIVRNILPQVDAQLPLFGTIVSELAPDGKNRPQYTLDVGANQGIVVNLKLDVYSKRLRDTKVGELKIVSVEPSTSVARLHKLDRSIRRSGGSIAMGDEVLSKKRPVYYSRRDLK